MNKVDPHPSMVGEKLIDQTVSKLAPGLDTALRMAADDVSQAYKKIPDVAARLDGMAKAFNWRAMELSRVQDFCIANGIPFHRGRTWSAQLPNNVALRINLVYSNGTTSAKNINRRFEGGQQVLEGLEPPTEIVIGRQMARGNTGVEAFMVTCPLEDGYTLRKPLSDYFPDEGSGTTSSSAPTPELPTTKTKLKAKRVARDERPAAFVEPAVFPDPAEVKEEERHG